MGIADRWITFIFTTLSIASTFLISTSRCQSLPPLKIDRNSITVSGISSGGAMAQQLHVAHSCVISGMASVAGPPYWCSQGNLVVALSSCETQPELISVTELWAATAYAADLDTIDETTCLENDSVYMVSGTKDSVVVTGVVEKAVEYYSHYQSNVQLDIVQNAEHSWLTSDYGSQCDYLGSPYINNCNFDLAGNVFTQLYKTRLQPAVNKTPDSQLFRFDQALYTPLDLLPAEISLDSYGYVYIPTACMNGKQLCRLHVALHGCLQQYALIGDKFVRHSGLNNYAETNNIVVLYPQTVPILTNPKSCWDWWGFTGEDFATKLAPQIMFLINIIDAILS